MIISCIKPILATMQRATLPHYINFINFLIFVSSGLPVLQGQKPKCLKQLMFMELKGIDHKEEKSLQQPR